MFIDHLRWLHFLNGVIPPFTNPLPFFFTTQSKYPKTGLFKYNNNYFTLTYYNVVEKLYYWYLSVKKMHFTKHYIYFMYFPFLLQYHSSLFLSLHTHRGYMVVDIVYINDRRLGPLYFFTRLSHANGLL